MPVRREAGLNPRRRRSSRLRIPVPAFFLVFGLVAVLSGYFLGKLAISVWETSKGSWGRTGEPLVGEAPGASTGRESTIDLPSIGMYRLQLGVFSSPENAQELAEKVTRAQLPAAVVGEHPYKVVGGYFNTKEAGQKAAVSYTGKGFDVYVASAEVGGGTLEVKGLSQDFEEALFGAFGEVGTVLEVEAGIWDTLAQGGTPQSEVLTGLETGVREANLRLSEIEAPSGWESIHVMVTDLLNLSLENVVELQAYQEKDDPSHFASAGVYFIQMVSAYEDLLDQAVMAAGR